MIDRTKLITSDGTIFDPSRYEVTLRPLGEREGGGWLAAIPALPGCTGDGSTEMEAIEDVRLAALEWADAVIADGDPLPAPPHRNPMAAE
jgi:predicted RNase H-like HicB family nuclease